LFFAVLCHGEPLRTSGFKGSTRLADSVGKAHPGLLQRGAIGRH
jgi:hypothetical protein